MKGRKFLAGLLTFMFLLQEIAMAIPMAIAVESSAEALNAENRTSGISETVSLMSEKQTFTGNEWKGVDGNSQIYQVNREDTRADTIPYDTLDGAITSAIDYDKSQSKWYKLLSQENWDFKLYDNDTLFQASADTLFFSESFDSAAWNEIFVPSVWQLQEDENGERYDDIRYLNTGFPWNNDATGNKMAEIVAPAVPQTYNPVGLYRYEFDVSADWENRRTYIVFEGAGSGLYVWVNGQPVGYSEDTHMTSEFDITDYVKPGQKNVLCAKVIRWADGTYLENQDGIRYSGITRDVYLYSTEDVRLRDFYAVTDFDSTYTNANLKVDAYVQNYTDTAKENVELTISLYEGENKTTPMSVTGNVISDTVAAETEATYSFNIPVSNPNVWSAETPNLYTMVLELKVGGTTVSYDSYRIGFREISYRKLLSDGSYGTAADCTGVRGTDWEHERVRLNGNYLYFKGVNRNEVSPDTGWAVSKELIEKDIQIIKANNINAVRTSHAPSSPYFYYLCNKYGLYVMGEANQEASGIYGRELITSGFSEPVKDRSRQMILRDRNNPCVVIWSYGNESGLGQDPNGILYKMGDYIHDLDPTRPVQYEPFQSGVGNKDASKGEVTIKNPDIDESAGGVDYVSGMYKHIPYTIEHGESGNPMSYIACEYVHAMGNAIGSIGDYWDVIRTYDNLQGGFIWDFADQGVWMTDASTGARYLGYGGDWGDKPNDDNFCANGIVSADRTLQPEIYEVKRVYQNILFEDVDVLNGEIKIKNENIYLDTNDYETRSWELVENGTVIQSGTINTNISAFTEAVVNIPFSAFTLKENAEYFLNLEISRNVGNINSIETYETNKGQIRLPSDVVKTIGVKADEIPEMSYTENDTEVTVTGNNFTIKLSKTAGGLSSYVLNGNELIDEPLKPDFNKAWIDNDKSMNGKEHYYKLNDDGVVTQVGEGKVIEDGNRVIGVAYSFKFTYEKWGSALVATYTVLGTGDVNVSFDYNIQRSNIAKLGSNIVLDEKLDTVTFYGKGPYENYNDRNRGYDVGLYTVSVEDMFTEYIKPNDSGNRMDVRFALLSSSDESVNEGLMFVYGNHLMQVGASHYKDEHMYDFNKKAPRHLYQVTRTPGTVLDVDWIVSGVGTGACGPDVMDEYLVQREHSIGGVFAYSIRPVDTSAITDEQLFEIGYTEVSDVVSPDLSKAKEALENYKTQSDSENAYTSETFIAFDEAYVSLALAVKNGEVTQNDIDTLVKTLEQKAEALVSTAAADKTLLTSAINSCSDTSLKDAVQAAVTDTLTNAEINALYRLVRDGKDIAIQFFTDDMSIRNCEHYYAEEFLKATAKVNALSNEALTDAEIVELVLGYARFTSQFRTTFIKLTGNVSGGEHYSANHGPDKIHDGIIDKYNYTAFDGTYGDAWSMMETDGMYKLDHIKFYPVYRDPATASDANYVNKRFVNQIFFEGSKDNETWVRLAAAGYKIQSENQMFKVKPIYDDSYKYYRMYVDAMACGLSEVEYYAYAKDSSYLQKCLSSAETIVDTAPEFAKADVQNFINVAKNILVNIDDYSQAEINEVSMEWQTIADSVGGDARINLYSEILAFEEVDINEYTSETYFAAYDAYRQAKLCYNDEAATVNDMEEAGTNLENAIAVLEVSFEKLTGTTFNSDNIQPNQYTRLFDGIIQDTTDANKNNFIDIYNVGDFYIAIDLGEGNAKTIEKVVYYPRKEQYNNNRLPGVCFEGSNDKSSWNELARIATAPSAPGDDDTVCLPYTLEVSDNTAYRYIRAYYPNGTCGSMTELEFYAKGADKTLLGTELANAKDVTDTSCRYYEKLQTVITEAQSIYDNAKATQAQVTNAVVKLSDAQSIIAYEKQYAQQITQAKDLDLNGYTTLTYVAVMDNYNAYINASDMGDVFGIADALEALDNALDNLSELSATKLTGTSFGSTTNANTLKILFDGIIQDTTDANKNNFVDFATTEDHYIAVDFGENAAKTVSRIVYYPRKEQYNNNRLLGTRFEGSNDKTTWTKLASIDKAPAADGDTNDVCLPYTLEVSDSTAYRYVRVFYPAGTCGSMTELEFYSADVDTTGLQSKINEAEQLIANGKIDENAVSQALQNARTALNATTQSVITNAYIALTDAMAKGQSVKITFETKVGTGAAPEVISGAIGTTVYLPTQSFTVEQGYTFAGWTDGVKTYNAESAYVLPAQNVTLTALWTAPVTGTFSTDSIDYSEGFFEVTLDKQVGNVTTANVSSDFASYVTYNADTKTIRAYVNYVSFKVGQSYGVSIVDLKDETGTVTFTGSISQSIALTINANTDPDANLIPNGSFDIPWNAGTMAAEISTTTKDGTGYSLFMPSEGRSAWSYIWWNVSFDENKKYYLEYDAMPHADSNGNTFTSSNKVTVNSGVATKSTSHGTNTGIATPSAAYGTWVHAEGLVTPADGSVLTNRIGIFSNPTVINGTNMPTSYFVDNVSLKEAFAIEFKNQDGTETLSKTVYYPKGKVFALPALDGLVWYDGNKTYEGGSNYITTGSAVVLNAYDESNLPAFVPTWTSEVDTSRLGELYLFSNFETASSYVKGPNNEFSSYCQVPYSSNLNTSTQFTEWKTDLNNANTYLETSTQWSQVMFNLNNAPAGTYYAVADTYIVTNSNTQIKGTNGVGHSGDYNPSTATRPVIPTSEYNKWVTRVSDAYTSAQEGKVHFNWYFSGDKEALQFRFDNIGIFYLKNREIAFDIDGEQTKVTVVGQYLTEAQIPENPTRAGFVFKGWSDKANGTPISDLTAFYTAEDTTLYAVWQRETKTSVLNGDITKLGECILHVPYDVADMTVSGSGGYDDQFSVIMNKDGTKPSRTCLDISAYYISPNYPLYTNNQYWARFYYGNVTKLENGILVSEKRSSGDGWSYGTAFNMFGAKKGTYYTVSDVMVKEGESIVDMTNGGLNNNALGGNPYNMEAGKWYTHISNAIRFDSDDTNSGGCRMYFVGIKTSAGTGDAMYLDNLSLYYLKDREITFNIDGVTSTQTIVGQYLTAEQIPSVPDKEDFMFIGWAKTENGDVVTEDLTTFYTPENTTLYAVYSSTPFEKYKPIYKDSQIRSDMGANASPMGMGIRVISKISQNVRYEIDETEMGFVVTRKALLDEAGINASDFTFESNVKKVDGVSYKVENDITTVDKLWIDLDADSFDAFTAVMTGIPVKQYKDNLVFRSYIRFNMDGENNIVYGDSKTVNVYDIAWAICNSQTAPEKDKVYAKSLIDAYDRQNDTVRVIAGSDFQPTGTNEDGKTVVDGLLNSIKGDLGITTAEGFLFCGDYDYNTIEDPTETLAGIAALQEAVQDTVLKDNMVLIKGNHDKSGAAGLATSGNNDTSLYGVFVINEGDMVWNGNDEQQCKATAESLREYMNEKIASSYDKPIFVLSHLPLHYSMRTNNNGDGTYAKYIFDVLNQAGAKGLNIIFMFGHNHSNGWDDYLGGSSIYLQKNDTIQIADYSQTEFNEHVLNFTYMNAGYVGYYSSANTGADKELTMTVFEITDNAVKVSRYNSFGKRNLKATGVSNAAYDEAYEPNTTVYSSPQVITLTAVSDNSPILPNDATGAIYGDDYLMLYKAA